MKKEDFPKVLVVTTNAWRDNTGINTLIEFLNAGIQIVLHRFIQKQRFLKPRFVISFSVFQRMLS